MSLVYNKYLEFELFNKLECIFDAGDVDDILNEIIFVNIDNVEEVKGLLEEGEYSALARFKGFALKSNLIEDIFDSIFNEGAVRVIHPFKDEFMLSRHSVQCEWGSFLRFLCGGETIYVYQFNFTIEGFFIPGRRLSIFFKGLLDVKEKTKNLISKVAMNSNFYALYFDNFPTFGGFKVEHPSPYHFYYLKLIDLFKLTKNFSLDMHERFNVVTTPKGCFLKVEEIFPSHVDCRLNLEEFTMLDGGYVPSECYYNEFYCGLGTRWRNLSNSVVESQVKAEISCLDDIVLRKSREMYAGFSKGFSEALKKNYFIIWLGVTTGKRRWIEEADAYINLIKKMLEIHAGLIVFIDGWTATHQEKGVKSSNNLFNEDSKVAENIIGSFSGDESVVFFSLIGKKAEEKIAIADKVDFFVANHATGSIWVSRVARKSGVTHISNAARKSAKLLHIHWSSSLISAEDVFDIKESCNPTVYNVSYSVSVDSFLSKCFYKLYCDSVLEKKAREGFLLNKSCDIEKGQHLKYFDDISMKVNPQHKSADILRLIAMSFEKSGDINTAIVLMRKAHELRPNGPVIKSQLLEYIEIKEGNYHGS